MSSPSTNGVELRFTGADGFKGIKKLVYFGPAEGPPEMIRIALTLAGIPFENVWLWGPREWPAEKPKSPFGGLPMLEFEDGTKVCQNAAIIKYIGRCVGMYPHGDASFSGNSAATAQDAWNMLKMDELFACMEDIRNAMSMTMFEPDPEKKKAKRIDLCENQMKWRMGKIEEMLCCNGCTVEQPFTMGGMLTNGDGSRRTSINDCYLYGLGRWFMNGVLDNVPTDYFVQFPLSNAVIMRLHAEPKLIAYYEFTAQRKKEVIAERERIQAEEKAAAEAEAEAAEKAAIGAAATEQEQKASAAKQ